MSRFVVGATVTVGSTVGFGVLENDGRVLGMAEDLTLGFLEGSKVGFAVGRVDGLFDEICVLGIVLGDFGLRLGEDVNTFLVGDVEGIIEGLRVGERVGKTDGNLVNGFKLGLIEGVVG